ncbi:MAG: hypothetical protein ACO1SV_19375 [Fimbriimonas sp.]
MNGIPMNAFLTPLFIVVAVAMMVGAARHKNASGNVRGITIAAGVALLVVGLLNTAFSVNDMAIRSWIPGTVIVSAFIGAAIGYWVGHTSHPAR